MAPLPYPRPPCRPPRLLPLRAHCPGQPGGSGGSRLPESSLCFRFSGFVSGPRSPSLVGVRAGTHGFQRAELEGVQLAHSGLGRARARSRPVLHEARWAVVPSWARRPGLGAALAHRPWQAPRPPPGRLPGTGPPPPVFSVPFPRLGPPHASGAASPPRAVVPVPGDGVQSVGPPRLCVRAAWPNPQTIRPHSRRTGFVSTCRSGSQAASSDETFKILAFRGSQPRGWAHHEQSCGKTSVCRVVTKAEHGGREGLSRWGRSSRGLKEAVGGGARRLSWGGASRRRTPPVQGP